MMTYANYGQELTDYTVFARQLHLPLNGTVAKVMRSNPDNSPDLMAAIEFQALDNGNEAHLVEKPNNGVEITPGGPFLLRILHQKQVSSEALKSPFATSHPFRTLCLRIWNKVNSWNLALFWARQATVAPHLYHMFILFSVSMTKTADIGVLRLNGSPTSVVCSCLFRPVMNTATTNPSIMATQNLASW